MTMDALLGGLSQVVPEMPPGGDLDCRRAPRVAPSAEKFGRAGFTFLRKRVLLAG
ncbi:hypothetical protein [Streptomyces sp. ML-6]|uniref:hypothetical protein n=1 Tax=Streptomyces sp. ML-6 TaxID=2982693 RepID=UPI0024BFE643|nr:hypothetical protein [Streptomyces sp. ML-6]MDK0517864.1 hypothetical protein [Streptomyces sp. ML-6]